MTWSAALSVFSILATLVVAVLTFFIRENSLLSWSILALSGVASIASAVTLFLNKREMAKIKNVTNAAAHSMFGGL